jgi:hypothetical protein
VVLDSAWTPVGGVGEALSVRPFFAEAVERHDLFAEALAVVDGWADAASATDRLMVEGVSYWFRMREPMWHWVHERLLWRYTVAAIERHGPFDSACVPASEKALADVLRALGRTVEVLDEAAPTAATARPRFSLTQRLVRLVARASDRADRAERRRREALVEARIAHVSRLRRPRAIVLTLPSSYQRIGAGGRAGRQDPNLGAVIPALRDAGIEPIVIGWAAGTDRAEDWAVVEQDDRMVPAQALRSRWGRPEDNLRADAATAAIQNALDGMPGVPLELDGLDLASGFREALRTELVRVVGGVSREVPRLERFLRDMQPAAVLLSQEHHRVPWLLAATRAGVPTFAMQHGVLYPAHPGYPDRRHPGLVLPTLTFVFGEYERRVLVGRAYRNDEVVVSGSPRHDLDAALATQGDADLERAAVRQELGVADGDQLLVVSTLHARFIRRSHLVHMLEAVLGGPLPGIHVVFKQHPGERDEEPYRQLLTGLARSGRYAPPPMSVVKEVDLYRLLRAADAHLGQQSTVLTDAVMAGTCNLIATVEASPDILGYVAAGVARPVRDVAELRTALAERRPVPADKREAFLRDHFRTGEASARIVATVRALIGDASAASATDMHE